MTHNCKDRLCTTPHYEEPIETGFTDKSIEIQCPECNAWCIGLNPTVVHILAKHPDYSAREAIEFAETWMEEAYQREEQNIRDYRAYQAEQRGLDK